MSQTRSRTSLALTLVVPAALAVAAPARADDRDDRIRELERVVREQSTEQARLRQKVEALESGRGAATDSGALRAAVEELLKDERAGGMPGSVTGPGGVARPSARLDLGGYFSTRWANSELPGEKPSFQDMRFVLQVHSQVARAVRFDGEIEFEHGGVSDEAGGEVKVEYAQVSLAESECFALKAGSLLVPWGRFNQEHDDPFNELSSRPTVSRFVHGAVFAAPGIGAEGIVPAGDELSFRWDVALVNGLSDDLSAGDGIRDSRTLWEDDDNHDKTVFARVAATPTLEWIDALDVGVSAAHGRLGEKADDTLSGLGFDAAAKWGPWEAKGEWASIDIDRERPVAPGVVHGLGGWYGQIVYRLRTSWIRSLPFADESASIGLVVRRDAVDLDDRVRAAAPGDDERAWTFGVNYRPTTKTVVKLEWRHADSPFPGAEGSDRDLFVVEFATFF